MANVSYYLLLLRTSETERRLISPKLTISSPAGTGFSTSSSFMPKKGDSIAMGFDLRVGVSGNEFRRIGGKTTF